MIRDLTFNSGLLPKVPVTKTDDMRYGYADFEAANLVAHTLYLPENYWHLSDYHQKKWLNAQIGGKVSGYIWHHTELPGKMQLVPYGIHQVTNHDGGRAPRSWAYTPKRRTYNENQL